MLFRPKLDTSLTIGSMQYKFLEHPNAVSMVYGQAGKRGTVYKIQDQAGKAFAFKVFTQKCRSEDIEVSAKVLAPYKDLPGLEVCSRVVLTKHSHADLIKTYPDLEYAVLMPWVQGETWFDVLKGHPNFSKEDSRYFATAFAKMLAGIEQRGLAHCDLSGPNLLLDFQKRRLALVDIEEMYGPGFSRPSIVPSGTAGYGHKTISPGFGLWGADADRFSGSILIAEILGKFDQRFQKEITAESESFFEKDELQTDSPRYQILSQILRQQYGQKVQALFEQAWFSASLDVCPSLAEWLQALAPSQETSPAGAATASPRVAPSASVPRLYNPFADGEEIPVSPETPSRETARPTPPASTNQPSIQPPPVLKDGPVNAWRSLKPEGKADPAEFAPLYQMPAGQQADQGYFSSQPVARSAPPTAVTPPQDAPVSHPAVAKLPFNIFWGFAMVGVTAVAALMIFGSSVESIKKVAQSANLVAFYGIGSTGLGLLLGLLQAWVFKSRLRIAKRAMYVLITTLSGLIGGAVVGVIGNMVLANSHVFLPNVVAGLVIGAIGGCVASLGQNAFLGNASAAVKWFLFNLISWAVIWGMGWLVASLIAGPVGTSIGAGLILLLSGASLQVLLKYSPEIEF